MKLKGNPEVNIATVFKGQKELIGEMKVRGVISNGELVMECITPNRN